MIVALKRWSGDTESVDTGVLLRASISVRTLPFANNRLTAGFGITGIVCALVSVVAIEELSQALSLLTGIAHRADCTVVAWLLVVRIDTSTVGVATIRRAWVVVVTWSSLSRDTDTLGACRRATTETRITAL